MYFNTKEVTLATPPPPIKSAKSQYKIKILTEEFNTFMLWNPPCPGSKLGSEAKTFYMQTQFHALILVLKRDHGPMNEDGEEAEAPPPCPQKQQTK